jgi:hypothetical protein
MRQKMNKFDFIYHHKTEKKGSFELSEDSFRFKSQFIEVTVLYRDVKLIERVYGSRRKQIVIVSAEYSDPNCYNIILSDNSSMFFQVSFAEQDDLKKRLDKLQRKIYGGNRLGVGLVSKVPDAATLKQRDAIFERERPNADYSLVRAINALSEICGVEIVDTTI